MPVKMKGKSCSFRAQLITERFTALSPPTSGFAGPSGRRRPKVAAGGEDGGLKVATGIDLAGLGMAEAGGWCIEGQNLTISD